MTTFKEARAFLLKHRTDYEAAVKGFRWPDPAPFNWALDWFDAELARNPESADRPALWIVDAGSNRETKLSFAALSRRSNQVANMLRAQGVKRGDHLLLLLGNVVPLWETMLAAMKLGVVVIPATTLLTPDELRDRLDRGRAKVVVASQDQVAKFAGLGSEGLVRVVVGAPAKQEGWLAYEQAAEFPESFAPGGPTGPDDPMLLYFTSGTTAKPKLVRHSQRSYPVGGLSTMYWLGLQPGDIHLNISSPGWAKHAWSCFFAPWNAGATVFVVNQPRFDAKGLLATIGRCGVTTLCAPPTVWRLFIQEKLSAFKVSLREVCGAGEPLNPEVIDQVRAAWGADHPRRLRPDRNHGAGREFTGAEGEGGLDGPADARLLRSDHRRRGAGDEGGRSHAAARPAPAGRPDAGLSGRRRQTERRRRRPLSQRRRGIRRRRGLSDLRRPLRRRLQIVGLPHQPVRT
jgi:acetyl-CoA synthetase